MRSYRVSAHRNSLFDTMFASYPVVYLTMPDRVVDAIAGACCCRESLVSDEEVQVFSSPLPGEMSTRTSTTSQEGGLVRDRRTAGARAAATACWSFGSYSRGKDEGGRVVAGETCDALLLRGELEPLQVDVPSLE
jgi:hypothetical protein